MGDRDNLEPLDVMQNKRIQGRGANGHFDVEESS